MWCVPSLFELRVHTGEIGMGLMTGQGILPANPRQELCGIRSDVRSSDRGCTSLHFLPLSLKTLLAGANVGTASRGEPVQPDQFLGLLGPIGVMLWSDGVPHRSGTY